MLSVRLPEAEIRARLNGHLAIAAVNAPSLCVVAGPFDALDTLEAELKNEGVATRRLATSRAFHSPMMDPVLDQFSSRVAQIPFARHKFPLFPAFQALGFPKTKLLTPDTGPVTSALQCNSPLECRNC